LKSGRALRAVAVALALACPSLGCIGPGDYRCGAHGQCGDGFCEIDGRCSHTDTTCASGRRYFAREGDRSYQCVGDPCVSHPLVALAAGTDHACALRVAGGVSCWGRNDEGQLGDGTRTPRSLDVPVPELPPATAIAAGARHTCAVVAAGQVYCWGADEAGQLGDGGGDVPRLGPTAVPGITDAVGVAAGAAFSCALLRDGTARCWGDGTLGQLGDGAPAATRRAPTQVFALAGLRALSAHGQHACALRDDETLWCWGDNSQGQLGDGTFTSNGRPVRVQPLTSVTAVATSLLHSCAATRAEGLFCWGNNLSGQLGREPGGPQPRPVAVPIVTNPVAVAAGDHHTCAVRQGGDTLCWGANNDGQLGEGSTSAIPFPVPVSDLGASAGVVAGGAFTCARGAHGDVFCWGDDHYGQLGMGRTAFRARAARAVDGEGERLTDALELATGAAHTCVVHDERGGAGAERPHVACWGANQAGQLGDGTIVDRSGATAVKGEIEAATVAAGLAHTCALATGGALWCWGRGSAGQLGPSRTVDTSLPTMVDFRGSPAAAEPMAGITAGDAFTCGWQAGGAAFCWGANDDGQLGDHTMMSSPTPANDGTGLMMVDALSAGADHACARLTDGGLRCWGRGGDGQLGDGNTTMGSSTPLAVALTSKAAPAPAAAVAAGAAHSCALDEGGHVWCWGSGAGGRLGTEAETDALAPVMVGGLAGARAVAAGGAHTCAVTEKRTVLCWGANDDGQLGNDDTLSSWTPVAVTGLTEVEQLGAGVAHTCARRAGGEVWCWGANFAGQLGDGGPLFRPTPQLSRLGCR
jgi:alpha-tubulin suppressor-like RCC1 family protein